VSATTTAVSSVLLTDLPLGALRPRDRSAIGRAHGLDGVGL
jgi:hypothetical protein